MTTPRTGGLGRASAILAAGTMVSRVTGLLRSVVLVLVIGSVGAPAADAFTIAGGLPQTVFQLISVGILTAVIVPEIVKASRAADGGSAFLSKLFTLGTVVLLAATALAMILAPWLVRVSADGTPEQLALATAFAYWCLPQIFFYGLYALVGEALNARRVFGPFTWSPIANNIVSIAGFLIIIALFGDHLGRVEDWTPTMIAALGGTATLGIAVQAGILFLFWRRTGLRVRPDFRWRGMGLGNIGRMASWTFLMALISIVAGTVQTFFAVGASGDGNASAATMAYAWLIFMLPYSIIVHSIGTPYFTQLSEHAAAGRDDEVRHDIAQSIRTLGFFLFAALAAVVAAALPVSRIFTQDQKDASTAGLVLLCYLVGLIPLAVLFIIQRTFYAYGDTRTPFFFTLVQCVLVVLTAILASVYLPLEYRAAGIALGQSISGLVQTILATWLLHRRLGSVRTASWLVALGRFTLAAVPAGAAGWGVFLLAGGTLGWMTATQILGVAGAMLIGAVVLIVYVGVLALLRAPELGAATGLVKRFLPGR